MHEIGVDVEPLVQHVVLPLAKRLFPEWGMFQADRQHAFTVHYGPNLDEDLKMHMDGAEVTFNLCLEKKDPPIPGKEERLIFGLSGRETSSSNKHAAAFQQKENGLKILACAISYIFPGRFSNPSFLLQP